MHGCRLRVPKWVYSLNISKILIMLRNKVRFLKNQDWIFFNQIFLDLNEEVCTNDPLTQ